MFFMIRRLRVLLETFRKPLGNRSSCVDVFRLREESGCPDSVAFFKRFIWEVGFQVGRLLGCQLGFVFLISIFYEGWEGASPTGVYSFGVLPLCIPFRFSVGLTADTAAQEASGHFDGSGAEVDLRTGKRLGLDQTRTSQDRKSQDRTGPQPQSGLQSFANSRIPGLVKDWSGPVRTSLLIGNFIDILSIFRTLIY